MAAKRPRLKQPHRPATDAELSQASEISAADIVHAGIAWERDAPPAFRTLLDARAVEPKAKPRPGTATS